MAISQKLLNEGEHVIVTTRTHVKALFLPILVLLVTLAAAIYLGTLGDGTTGKVIDIVVWVLAAIVIVWWVVRPFLTWLTTSYTFTNRRFLARSGFIAKEGRTIAEPHQRGRLRDQCGRPHLRLRHAGLSDASEQGRVELHDIPRVEQVQLKVADELHRLSEQRNDDGV